MCMSLIFKILGTYTILEAARQYWSGIDDSAKVRFCFLHVSTDEVYGSLGPEGLFDESTPYDPSSPCAASTASSEDTEEMILPQRRREHGFRNWITILW